MIVDPLELELDEEYPDGDDGGGVSLFDDDLFPEKCWRKTCRGGV